MIPIPASPEEDAGTAANGYPVVVSAQPDFTKGLRLQMNTAYLFTLTLADGDIGDALYVRIFRDYTTDPMHGPVNDFEVTNDINGKEVRQPYTFDVDKWCVGAVLDTQMVFDVVVADRPFDPNPSTPTPYKTVTKNGKSSTRSWFAQCVQQVQQ